MPKLFGTAGYRAPISKDSVLKILLIIDALCQYLKSKRPSSGCVLVSYDTRSFDCLSNDCQLFLSSKIIAKAAYVLIKKHGFNARFTKNPTPSPVLSWMAFKQAQLGLVVTEIVNITASHNRFDYVGIKLSNPEGEPESDCTYECIEQIIEEIENKEDFDCFGNSHLSLLAQDQQIEIGDYLDYESSYIKKLRDNFNLPKSIKNHFKIAVDYSYGNAIGYIEKIFANTPIQIFPIHKAGLVGKNFDPDTEKGNLVSLMDLVKREHCDFGICLDTDGNKISFIDENGDYINTDTVLALLVEDLIRKNKKTWVYYPHFANHKAD